MNFRKLLNGEGGSFPIRKIMLRFFGKGKALRAPISRAKAQHLFSEKRGGVRGRLEVFRKFIKFGPGSHPLGKITWTKFDEFSENFQTASDPPPIFGKKCCAFVREIGARSAFPLPKKRNIIFRIGNDPLPPIRKFSENSLILVQVVIP